MSNLTWLASHLFSPLVLPSTNLRLGSLFLIPHYPSDGPKPEKKEGIAPLEYKSFMHCNGLKEP